MKRVLVFLVLASICASYAAKSGAAAISATANGEWKIEDDSPNGGNSTAKLSMTTGRSGANTAARLDYTLGPSYQYRYALLQLKYPGIQDRSKYKGIRFWVKGSGSKLEVDLCQNNVADYDYHMAVVNQTGKDWTEVTIPFSQFKQAGWGKKVAFNQSLVNKVQFKAASMKEGETGFFIVDGIEYTTDSPFVDKLAGENFLLADFEGTLLDKLGNEWGVEDDSPNKGDSKGGVTVGDGQGGSKGSMRLAYTLGPSYQYRYTIAKVEFQKPLNITDYKTLKFWMKGSGNKVKVHLCSDTVKDYDWHEYVIESTPSDWKLIEIPFTAFQQEGWGKAAELDQKNIIRIQFQTGSMADGEQGWFEVDNLMLSKLPVRAK